jgi:hypothetical protein
MKTTDGRPKMTTLDEFGIGETDDSFYSDSGEAGFDEASEYDDSESRRSRARARRKAELRRRQLERVQAAQAGGSRLPVRPQPVPGAVGREVRRTQAAVREVGLENKVQADAVSSAMNAQSKRAGGTEYAVVAGIVVNQLLRDFGNKSPLNNPVAQAALGAAPLFLLKPARGSSLTNPKIVGPVLVAASVFGKQIFDSVDSKEVFDVEVRQAPAQLTAGQRFTLKAVALDKKNQTIRDTVPVLVVTGAAEESLGSGIFKVDAAGKDDVIVTATAGGKKTTLLIPVQPRSSSSGRG